MAPTNPKTATAIAPTTPPSSQNAVAQLVEPDSLQLSTQYTPTTPISPPEDPRPKKRRRIVRITRPEPGSIYDIMHDHAGESLFVTPICWTAAHTRLLGVEFVDCEPIRKPVPDFNSASSRYPPRPSAVATELSRDLTSILSPKPDCYTASSIKQVMHTFFPDTLSKAKSDVEFQLHFEKRILKRAVRVTVLWKQPDSLGSSFDSAATKPIRSSGQLPSSSREVDDSQISDSSRASSQWQPKRPVLAFLNRAHLNLVRSKLYRVAPGPVHGDQGNTPVRNLQRLRSKQLVPEDRNHDPYLVAIMLAMAQSQCYPTRSSSRSSSQRSSQGSSASAEATIPQPLFKDVPVKILQQDNQAAEFVVYSAVVTAAFLRRFAEPTKAPTADAPQNGGLKIEVTRVPIWPVLGLKERLGKALGTEIAKEEISLFADGGIETWESDREREIRLGTLKRRRDALSEVYNTSFDTDVGSPGRDSSSSAAVVAGLSISVASPPLSPRTPKRRRTQAMNELEVC